MDFNSVFYIKLVLKMTFLELTFKMPPGRSSARELRPERVVGDFTREPRLFTAILFLNCRDDDALTFGNRSF